MTYNEVNDLIPGDLHSPDDLDDLITTIGTQGIDISEDGPKFGAEKFDPDAEEGEDVELDLTPGTLEKTNDPVRMYLREMGTVPLLTREGEVEIAKRIERGQMRVLKAISRSPIVIREVIALWRRPQARRAQRKRSGDLRRRRDHRRDPAGACSPDCRPHRHHGEAPEEDCGSHRKARQPHRTRPQGQGPRPAQDPLGDRPREGLRLADRPRAEVHQRRAQAAARQGQQDRRRDADARAADQVARPEARFRRRARSCARNIAASRRTARSISKSWSRMPGSPSPTSSALSAR